MEYCQRLKTKLFSVPKAQLNANYVTCGLCGNSVATEFWMWRCWRHSIEIVYPVYNILLSHSHAYLYSNELLGTFGHELAGGNHTKHRKWIEVLQSWKRLLSVLFSCVGHLEHLLPWVPSAKVQSHLKTPNSIYGSRATMVFESGCLRIGQRAIRKKMNSNKASVPRWLRELVMF